VTGARERFFAVCAPGLEPLLHEELRALRAARVERQVGGVAFEGTLRDAWRANLELRTATRVLRRVARFEAVNAEALHAGAAAVDWTRFLAPGGRLRVDARSKESALSHTLYVEQLTKDAVCDAFRARFGTRPSVDLEDPDLAIDVHLYRDRCTLSVDTSGESLHKRGWRRFQGRAPLSETFAAACVLASGWDRRAPLVDPFCGSGTILIEAALLAADVAPGSFGRAFGFERWPGHERAAFEALRLAARGRARFPAKLVLRGWDADAEVVEGARANMRAAGLEGRIELEVARAEDLAWKRGWNAWIVTNPPWGERVGEEREILPAIERFASALRARAGGYELALLSGNPKIVRALGLAPRERLAWRNGPLEVELVLLTVPDPGGA
jgi:23S rRNA G2445 N2-methylase RlmL